MLNACKDHTTPFESMHVLPGWCHLNTDDDVIEKIIAVTQVLLAWIINSLVESIAHDTEVVRISHVNMAQIVFQRCTITSKH